MARSLAILRQALECLVDQFHVVLIDIETQQAKSARGAPTDAVKELEPIAYKVVRIFIRLMPQEVLKRSQDNETENTK